MAAPATHIRIPFAEAISEKLLFKASWHSLSAPQQAILKCIYGLPLTVEEKQLWDAFNGFGRFSEIGELLGTSGELPYTAQEYEDVTLIIGRRGGKTSGLSSFIAAYEGLCGGHKEHVAEKQLPVVIQVAQDLVTARLNMNFFVKDHLERSPIGRKELTAGNTTADSIKLKGCLIMTGPSTIKLRGQAIAVACMDELAVWPKDRESANPDVEVENAIRPAMAQFPFRKLIKTSTPWIEDGLLWQAAQSGTWNRLDHGAKAAPQKLVLVAPTLALKNPKVSAAYLLQERAKDSKSFDREYLAQFAKSVSGFLKPEMLKASVERGVISRLPEKGPIYVACMDPAFRKDAFAFVIGHLDERGAFTVDHADSLQGSRDKPLSPSACISYFGATCQKFGIRHIISDQYHSESLTELANAQGFSIESVFLTYEVKRKMWGDVISLLAQGKLRLIQHEGLLDELLKMEQVLTPMGGMQYRGKRDDLAHAFALCCHRCLQFGIRKPASDGQNVQQMSYAREMELIHLNTMGRLKQQTEEWYA